MSAISQAKFDNRRDLNFPISREAAITLAIAASTTKTVPTSLNGELLGFVYTCPSLTTDTTFVITIDDKNGANLFTSTALAHNKTTAFYVHLAAVDRRFLHGNCDITVTIVTSQTNTIIFVPILR